MRSSRLLVIGTMLAVTLVFLICGMGVYAKQQVIQIGTWMDRSVWDKRYGDKMEAFTEAYPEIVVEPANIASHGNFANKVVVLATVGDLPDILHVPPEQVAPLMGSGVLEDLSGRIERDPQVDPNEWLPAPRQAVQFRSQVIGMPAYVVNYCFGYNKEILSNRGVLEPEYDKWLPWDSIVHLARKLTADSDGDGENDLWGYSQGGFDFDRFLPLVYQAGGKAYENQRLVLDSEEAKQALRWWLSLVDSGSHPPYGLNQVGTFMEKKTATIRFGSWMTENAEAANINLGVAPGSMQKVKSEVCYVTTWSMSSQAKHPQEAWCFLRWSVSPESQEYVALRNRVPIRSDVELPPEKRETLTGLIYALQHAQGYPLHPESNYITSTFNQEFGAVWQGEKAPDILLEDLTRVVNMELAK